MWEKLSSEMVYENPVLGVERSMRRLTPGNPSEYVVLRAPDWVNVLAVTTDEKMVLIRQWRHGIEDFTLEIPGGMVDQGESPAQAAARELEEETGYKADHWESLGWVNPNPALFANRCHTYLALGARPCGPARPEDTEQIEVRETPLEKVRGLVASGEINHSLVVSALALFWLRNSQALP